MNKGYCSNLIDIKKKKKRSENFERESTRVKGERIKRREKREI